MLIQMRSYIFGILFCLLLIHSVQAQQNVKFERISLEQGLSQSSVFCILQDSRGFMWFGTEDALNRYDGYEFVHYKYDPTDSNSISSGHVTNIIEDSDGNLWIGTDEGLNMFDRESGIFHHWVAEPENENSLLA